MTSEQMAHLHASAFANQGRAWSKHEFKSLLENPHCFYVGDNHSFAIGRAIADQAELLTLATDPDHQRVGLARLRLNEFEQEAIKRGAACVLLEVAYENSAALALYMGAGYNETAQRKGYYKLPDGRRSDALILQKIL